VTGTRARSFTALINAHMKAHISINTSRNLAAIAAVSLTAAVAAPAQIVSVNIAQNLGTDIQQIDSDETFGVAAYGSVVGGWLNLNTAANNLTDSLGLVTTVDIALSQPNGQATFNAAYGDTPLHAGLDDYTTTVNPVSITLSDLNATYASGYFAIVYVGGFNANTGASISDGSSTYYYKPLPSPSAPVTFQQTTQTSDLGAGNNPTAQYAVFGSIGSPLTANSITFTLDTLSGGGSGLGGIQIVAVPEPSSAALLMLAVGLRLVGRRLRRAGGS
jgi:hypothetical protein